MNFNEYQNDCLKTALYPANMQLAYPALGLAGEAGEICNKVKKVFRDDKGILSEEKRREIAAELGDVLWYIAAVASDLNVDLDDVADANLEKLASRRARDVLQGSGDNR